MLFHLSTFYFLMNMYCFYNEGLKIQEKGLGSEMKHLTFQSTKKSVRKWNAKWISNLRMCKISFEICLWDISQELIEERSHPFTKSLGKRGEWVPGDTHKMVENGSWWFASFWIHVLLQFKILNCMWIWEYIVLWVER